MKRIVCEMCGGTDIIKENGVFVCQSCGCKYSLEEARKMMVEIEGTVKVKGTVQVDNSSYVERYLQNARRAKEKEDWEETEKYYNLVEQNEPDNIEAIFYSAYGKAKISLLEQDIFKRKQAFKVLTNCVSIIDDNYTVEKREREKDAIENMSRDILQMVTGNFIYSQTKNGYGITTKTTQGDTYDCFIRLIKMFIESVNNIVRKDDQLYLHEILRFWYVFLVNCPFEYSFGLALTSGAVEVFDVNNNSEYWQTQCAKEEDIIHSRKKEEMQKYWSEHAEEKKQLEDEREELTQKLQSDGFVDDNTIKQLENEIQELEEKINSLGFFKTKEIKRIEPILFEKRSNLADIKKRNDEISKKVFERVREIEEKLGMTD